MNKFFVFIFFVLVFLFAGCKLEGLFSNNGFYDSQIMEEDEKRVIREMKNPPDFSTRRNEPLEFKDFDYPEKLLWHSSYAHSFGSPAAKQGGSFYTYLHDIPNTFRYCGPGSDGITEKLFWNHVPLLVQSPEDRAFLPAAASHWAFSKDGKTVYYKLNPNSVWSDGTPCTADDFVFAADFMKSKEIADISYAPAYGNLSVKKISRHCIAITYSGETFGSQQLLLSFTNIKPRAKHFYGGAVPKNWIKEFNRRAEPTTGAYYLEHFDINYGLSFKKKKDWWGHEYEHFKNMYNFETIEMRILPGTQQSVRKYFRNAQLDSLPLQTAAEWRNALDDARVKRGFVDIWISEYNKTYGMQGLFFNTAFPLFANADVRRGVSLSLDIDGMIKTVLNSHCTRAQGMGINRTCGEVSFDNRELKAPAFDPAAAAEIFEHAGFSTIGSGGIRKNSKGERLSFTILYGEMHMRDSLGYLYSQALKAGVELKFKFMSGGILNKVSQGGYEAWWGSLPYSYLPDNYNYFHSASINSGFLNNIFSYADPDMDKLLEEFRQRKTLPEKAEVNKKIEQKVFDLALFVPGYYENCKLQMIWKWIRFPGWLSRRYTEDFADPFNGTMWFDDEIKKECDIARQKKLVFAPRCWSPSSPAD